MNDMVSVIVPVFNSEATVTATLRSVMAQTYKDIEIIAIDDGSTDGSYQRCVELMQEDTRIRVFHQENRGVSAARNAGVEAARGGYITFVDADDLIHPRMIEVLYDGMQRHGADISIGNIVITPQGERVDFSAQQHCDYRLVERRKLLEIALMRQIPLYCYGYISRRGIWDSVRFPEQIAFGEDAVTTLNVLQKCRSASIADFPVYHYIQTATGVTKNPKKRYVEDILANAEHVREQFGALVDGRILNAYLCSNYALAYNLNYKCGNDRDLRRAIRERFNECYRKTDRNHLTSQINRHSITLLRLGLYDLGLGIMAIK